MPGYVRPVLFTQLVAVLVAVLAVSKGYFHTWTAATTNPTPPSVKIMSVKRLPAVSGRDLQPGPVPVYAWYRDPTAYEKFNLPSMGGYEIVPIPHLAGRYWVVVSGNRVNVYMGPMPAPFTIVCSGRPKVRVNYSGVEVSGPCSLVLLKSVIWSGSATYVPPSLIVHGKMVRGYEGKVHHLAIISMARIPLLSRAFLILGLPTPMEITAVEARHGRLDVDGVRGVIRSRGGMVIRWSPIVLPNFTFQDLVWRYPRWPYSL